MDLPDTKFKDYISVYVYSKETEETLNKEGFEPKRKDDTLIATGKDEEIRAYMFPSIILVARILGKLLRVYVVTNEDEEILIWQDTPEFQNQTNTKSLEGDLLGLITSQLNPQTKASLRTVNEAYSKKISPVKWNIGNVKGISKPVFSELRQYFTLLEIAKIFIFYPDIVQTCIDNGLMASKLLKYAIGEGAYDTVLVLSKLVSMKNVHPEHGLSRVLLDDKFGKPTLQQSKVSRRIQLENLIKCTTQEELTTLINVYGFNTFYRKGVHLLEVFVERCIDENNTLYKPNLDILEFLCKQDGIEIGYEPYIFDFLNLKPSWVSLLCNNPKLFPKERLLSLYKYSALVFKSKALFNILTPIVLKRGYDIEDVLLDVDPPLLLEAFFAHSCLKCFPQTKNVIARIEDQIASSGSIKSKYYWFEENVELDLTSQLRKLLAKEADAGVVDNSLFEYKNGKLKFIVNLHYTNILLDYICSKVGPGEIITRNSLVDAYSINPYTVNDVEFVIRDRIEEKLPLSHQHIVIRPNTQDEYWLTVTAPKLLQDEIEKIFQNAIDEIDKGIIVIDIRFKINIEDLKTDSKGFDETVEEFKNYLIENGGNEDLSIDVDEKYLIVNTNSLDKVLYLNMEDFFYILYDINTGETTTHSNMEDYDHQVDNTYCYKALDIDTCEKIKTDLNRMYGDTISLIQGFEPYLIVTVGKSRNIKDRLKETLDNYVEEGLLSYDADAVQPVKLIFIIMDHVEPQNIVKRISREFGRNGSYFLLSSNGSYVEITCYQVLADAITDLLYEFDRVTEVYRV